jgi:hypothetical protein
MEAVITSQGQQFAALGSNLLLIVHTTTDNSDGYRFGGICDFIPSTGEDTFSGTVNNAGVTINFSDPLDSYIATGTVMNSSAITGSYTSSASSDCPYFGSFSGTAVTGPIFGTFSGTLTLLNGAVDQVSITITENNLQGNLSVSMNGSSTGTDNGLITLSGTAIANGLQANGTIGDDAVAIYALYLPSKNEIVVSQYSPDSDDTVGVLTLQ